MEPASQIPAVLLVGPTGSGKTPLGDLIERNGLGGRMCLHFDFGDNLRSCARGDRPEACLTSDECAFLQRVIDQGVLLEDEHFPIARKIFDGFRSCRGAADDALVVLNGLPRHVGQADAMDAIVRMEAVIHLECDADTVLARIDANTGGDRAGRTDDRDDAIRRRLVTYRERTAPLIEHYRSRGVRLVPVDVAVDTTPQRAYDVLVARW